MKCYDILDEADKILDPRFELNYPINFPINPDGGAVRWNLIIDVLRFLFITTEDLNSEFYNVEFQMRLN